VPMSASRRLAGDVVLQLAEFGESLVHQMRIDGTVEIGGVRAVLAAVAKKPHQSSWRRRRSRAADRGRPRSRRDSRR
jgi:hypothetical protein